MGSLNVPDWLNRSVFEKIVCNSENNPNTKLIDYEIKKDTEEDAHVASVMFRATIKCATHDGVNKQFSVFIKASLSMDKAKHEFLGQSNVFDVEIDTYTNVLPKIQKMLDSIDSGTALAPRMLYCSRDPVDVLVFEDLTEKGFACIDLRSVNVEEAKVFTRKLALLHAASYALYHQGYTHLDTFKNGLLNLPNVRTQPLYTTGIGFLADLAESVPEYEPYIKPIKSIDAVKLLEKCIDLFNTPGLFNVFNHADFHPRNIMFKEDENGKPVDAMLIDFQLCCWGSPGIDTSYINADGDDDATRVDVVYDFYFATFQETLQKLKFNGAIPTAQQFEEEINRFKPLRVFFTASFIPFMGMSEVKHEATTIMTSAEARRDLYHTKAVRGILDQMLPYFLENGFFDACK